jgi:hypothetical protein
MARGADTRILGVGPIPLRPEGLENATPRNAPLRAAVRATMSSSPPVSRLSPPPRPRSIPPPRRLLVGAIAAYSLAVAALDLGGFVPLPGSGPIGLAEVLSAHPSLGALALVPFAFLRGTRPIRLALLVLAIRASGPHGPSGRDHRPAALASAAAGDGKTRFRPSCFAR